MTLIFKGHESAPIRWVSSTECKDGHFKYDANWNVSGDNKVLTVTFSCVTLINKDLKGKELEDRKMHEKRHFQDFHALANKLKASLLKAIASGKDPDMDRRLKWFDYDFCKKSAAFHRQIGAMVEICFEPSGNQPQ